MPFYACFGCQYGLVGFQEEQYGAAAASGVPLPPVAWQWVQALILYSVQGERLLRYIWLDECGTAGTVIMIMTLSHAVAFISPRIRGVQLLCELMRDSI